MKRFRQHRDVRFSKDKAPDKTTTYGIELLRRKTVVVGARLPPGPDLLSRSALTHCLQVYEAAAPVATWLDTHVGPSTMTPEERFGRGR